MNDPIEVSSLINAVTGQSGRSSQFHGESQGAMDQRPNGMILIISERRRSGSRSQGRSWSWPGRCCGTPDLAGEWSVAEAVGTGVSDQVIGAIR